MEPLVLPTEVPVKLINRESAVHKAYGAAWDKIHCLYSGGVEIEANASSFLNKRPKELPEIYTVRLEQFTYQNHMGTCVDWWLAALFEKEPTIEPRYEADTKVEKPPMKPLVLPAPPKPGEPEKPPVIPEPIPEPKVTVAEPPELAEEDSAFYNEFHDNADRAGTPELEVYREFYKDLILYGRAALLVDLPSKPEEGYPNAAVEKEAGALNPYYVRWDPRQIRNYGLDSHGNLEWIIFSCRDLVAEHAFDAETVYDRWYYFDRKQFAVYEREIKPDERSTPEDAKATLKDFGDHALSAENRVPVIYEEIPEGLWLANRAYSAAKKHVNADNILDFALFMAALCMPVIKTASDYKPTLSEAGYIRLQPGDEYSWAEPEGRSFEVLGARCDTLKEEIFRSFYLVAQARTQSATPAAQSGISKQEDMNAPKKVLNLYGDVMRQLIQRARDLVTKLRVDGIDWDVRGMQFPEDPPDTEVDTVTLALGVGVPSQTFTNEMYKKVVDSLMRDANPQILAQIKGEIEGAPTQAERAQKDMEARAAGVSGGGSFGGGKNEGA